MTCYLHSRPDCFSIIRQAAPIPPEQLRRNLVCMDPAFEPFVDQTRKRYGQIRQSIKNSGIDAVITPRTLESFVRLSRRMSFHEAAELTLHQVKLADDAMRKAIRELFTACSRTR